MANREIRVFLSSTFEDLKEVRESIQTHLAILTTDLLAMEVFGSDENRPKEYSLATVRESNLFIGVYAERYGTLDPETGSSLTELEYKEAVRMLERGQMIGLLTYILDENASWPIRYIERNTGSLEKLRALKARIMEEHTVTFFKEAGELPLKVLKDVIRKLQIGMPSRLEVKPRGKEKAIRKLSQPIGMEFYDENERNFFQGREAEVAQVVHEVTTNRITLLVGESGIGKTSLIRAGVCPELAQLGWRTAYVRPLNKPLENISRLVWDQILMGGYPKGLRPKSVIDIVSDRLNHSKCLIVIDQFEDVLGIEASKDTDELVRDLTEFALEQNKNVHILIAYRGDLESRLGIFWQNISGSPTGLDRVYLGGLSSSGAKAALESNLKGCGLRFQEGDVLFNELVHDLIAESRNIVPGFVYPPLLQILAETVFKEARRGETFTHSHYIKTGRLPAIAGRYLLMRLQFLGERRELARRILVALVRSYGLKSQKTLADLALEIGGTEDNIRVVLNQLVQLRMVRPIDGHYEIVHDFLAKRISEELMEVYEREVKQFRELLASKLGAYTRTEELLTRREHLYLYFYRKQFACTQAETKYLFLSHLAGNGPAEYWIKDWSRETLEECIEEAFKARNEVVQRNAYRYAIRVGKIPLLETVAKLFGDYRHRNEFARYIPLLAKENDIPLLLKLRRKKAKEIKDVVDCTIVKLMSPLHQSELEMIARSSAKDIDSLLIDVADKFAGEKTHSDSKNWKTDTSLIHKILKIIALSSSGNNDDLHDFINAAVDKSKPKKLRGILYVATFRLAIKLANYSLIDELTREPELRSYLHRGIRDGQNQRLFDLLLSFWPHDGAQNLLSEALVHAVRRSTYKKVYPVMKRNLERSGVRELILAIARFGNALDFEKVLKILLKSKHQLLIPSPSIVAFAMRELAGRKHLSWLRQLVVLKEMRSYYGEDRVRGETLPIGNYLNIYLVRYFIAFAFCYLAGDPELPILVDLLESKYWCVSFPAAEALARLGKESSINEIMHRALAAQEDNRAGFLRGLVAVDRVVYPGISQMDGWELMYETA